MSLTTSSIVNTSPGSQPSMSRYAKAHSVGASGFGRLSIQNNGDDDMIDTRSSAKQGASSRGKDKGKAKAKPESSRKSRDDGRKSQRTTTKGGRTRPSDDDDDDDDDSSSDDDSDSDDSSSDGEQDALNRQLSKRYYLRMAMSVLNPDLLSPTEFSDPPSSDRMPDRSKALRAYADLMSQGLDVNGYNAAISYSQPNGAAWATMACYILRTQTSSAKEDFEEGDADAIDTLKRFSKIWDSIFKMLKGSMYSKMQENAKKEFVFILVDILNFIIRKTQDQAGSLEYAGSLHGHERNIHQRFIHKDGNWLKYMGILRELLRVSGVAALFREPRVQASLQNTWNIVCFCAAHAAPRAGPLGDFQDELQRFMQALGIPCPPPASER